MFLLSSAGICYMGVCKCVCVKMNITEGFYSCVHMCVNPKQLPGHTLSMIPFVKHQLLSLDSGTLTRLLSDTIHVLFVAGREGIR